MKFEKNILPCFILLILLFFAGCKPYNVTPQDNISQIDSSEQQHFNSSNAYKHIEVQVSYGPRTPESDGHKLTQEYISQMLRKYDWQIENQIGEMKGYPIENIIGKRGEGESWIILGAHYDTRLHADQDPEIGKRKEPVLGANDGASGVAILLELARVIPKEHPVQIWLVFFDAEDNGGISDREWIMGSRFFVNSLNKKPDMMILLDMVADQNLNLHYEKNSNRNLSKEIWDTAESLGYGKYFVKTEKYNIIDDHIPFIQAGIPAVDIIDFDYPYWHTTADTIDKINVMSLQVVGDTILSWLKTQSQ